MYNYYSRIACEVIIICSYHFQGVKFHYQVYMYNIYIYIPRHATKHVRERVIMTLMDLQLVELVTPIYIELPYHICTRLNIL